MVSKITIFEPHFDDAQFGPAPLGGDDSNNGEAVSIPEDSTDQRPATKASRGRWLLGGGVLVFVLLLGVIVVRRSRDREGETIDVERPHGAEISTT